MNNTDRIDYFTPILLIVIAMMANIGVFCLGTEPSVAVVALSVLLVLFAAIYLLDSHLYILTIRQAKRLIEMQKKKLDDK